MTNWRPDISQLRRPAYLSLAEQIARAIQEGLLPNGTRLLPHRKLADDLNLSVQTVSRAYDELIRRGLISGEIGRGSFVQTRPKEPEPPYLPERLGELVDLSILKPVCEQLHLERMREAFGWLAENLPSSSALSFRPNMVFPRHRAVAAEWLARCGLDVSPLNINLTNGATSGMTVALMSVAPPGATVATEAISHHTLVPLSTYLGLHLEGLPIDRDGMIPEALDEACRKGVIRAVFLQPSVINPTATLMSGERRQALADVAREEAGVDLEKARRYPDVTVSIGSQYSAEDRQRVNLVGVSLPLPLFDRNQGNVLSASRRADQARDLRNATELRLRGDVALALEQWRRAQAAIDAHDRSILPAAQQAVDSATRGFRMGKLAFLDVLDAQRTLIDARNRYLQAMAEATEAWASLERLYGDLSGLDGQA